MGIKNYTFLDFPDMKLDSIPHLEINKELEKVVSKFNPKIVYSPPLHDLNNDHRLVFNSALVATRPFSSSVKQLLSYECPGPVKHPFRPTVYQNIEKEFSKKLLEFIDINVVFWDERFSTQAQEKILIDKDLSRKKRKKVIDKLAASYFLQSFLDFLKN